MSSARVWLGVCVQNNKRINFLRLLKVILNKTFGSLSSQHGGFIRIFSMKVFCSVSFVLIHTEQTLFDSYAKRDDLHRSVHEKQQKKLLHIRGAV